MPTHQSLSGVTDDELVRRMVVTHPDRFGESFWSFFTVGVTPHLPARPTIVDLGCGPGLLLRDLGARYPSATLYGYDVTPAMIEHGRHLSFAGPRPTLAVHDVAMPLPHATASVDLVSMASVLHVLDEPFPVLAEIRRMLAPGGVFLLQDWIRQPLSAYLAWRRDHHGEHEPECSRRGFRLFPVQNKYTRDDWHWLLGEAGFAVVDQATLRPTHHVFAVRKTAA
jgi:SAM-dependent methyltransferase